MGVPHPPVMEDFTKLSIHEEMQLLSNASAQNYRLDTTWSLLKIHREQMPHRIGSRPLPAPANGKNISEFRIAGIPALLHPEGMYMSLGGHQPYLHGILPVEMFTKSELPARVPVITTLLKTKPVQTK